MHGTVDTVERACMDATLRLTSGDVTAAAQVLGLDEPALRAGLRALGMQPAAPSAAADRAQALGPLPS